jgi:hypothetical protein
VGQKADLALWDVKRPGDLATPGLQSPPPSSAMANSSAKPSREPDATALYAGEDHILITSSPAPGRRLPRAVRK